MSASQVPTFLDGGQFAFNLMVALGFARLGRATGDRLYSAFALAFVLLAIGTMLMGLQVAVGDLSVLAFMPRLLAFLTIIGGIVDKNRRAAQAARSLPLRPGVEASSMTVSPH